MKSRRTLWLLILSDIVYCDETLISFFISYVGVDSREASVVAET